MRRVCAWCDKELPPNDLKPAPGLPPDAVSHGMCEQCKKQLDARVRPKEGDDAR